jgi:pyruvate dehydrogenase E1 component
MNRCKPLVLPGDKVYDVFRKGSGKQSVATTMAFVRLLKDLMKDKTIGPRFVPIIPDEARTFGMDAMFPSAKIYSTHGQRYDPVDAEMLLSYREDTRGQILHEGISEAGSMASVIAAGSAYSTHGEPMIPIYVFYSMFGFQRTGDLMWAMGDQLANGFLIGATAGRTTLNGEGLQHEDGHSLLLAATNPACIAYDPAFAYELAIIVKAALQKMYGEKSGEDQVFYYLTVYNEPKPQPPAPDLPNLDEAVLKGLYRFSDAPPVAGSAYAVTAAGDAPRAQLIASGTAIHWALDAQRMLADHWGVAADVWSATSWTELRREALECDNANRLAAAAGTGASHRTPWITQQLENAPGPVIAVSDWMRAVPDQIAKWVPGDWNSLGTDGYGRSDTREALRRHFSVDAESIVLATLTELARIGEVKSETPAEAIEKYGLNA